MGLLPALAGGLRHAVHQGSSGPTAFHLASTLLAHPAAGDADPHRGARTAPSPGGDPGQPQLESAGDFAPDWHTVQILAQNNSATLELVKVKEGGSWT